jgi:hypothetical protein
MAKLVAIESGSIVPIPGTSELNYSIFITEKTRLIIDGDDITLIYEDGLTLVQKNHQLILNRNSNYREQPLLKKTLFCIKLGNMFARFRICIETHFNDFKSFVGRTFHTIFRKSHISNYDLMDLDSYLAKRILPKIMAYRKNYLEREVVEVPDGLFQEGQAFHDVSLKLLEKEMDEEVKAWIAVMDEIIFAMRWLLEARKGSKEIAFFKEYYGQYIAYEDDKDKHFEQTSAAEKRAQKGFELFGKFFTSFWY